MTITRQVAAAAVAILVSATAAQAQGLGYGAKAGVNFMSVTFEDDTAGNGSAKPGIVAGGFVTFGLASWLSAEVDAYYSERKFNFEESDVEDRLAYVELPILARVRVVTNESWNLRAVGGIALSFLQSATETISGTEYDSTSLVESMETAAVVGAQAQIGRWLVVDFRYLFGLTDVYVAPDFPAKSKGFQITAGYRFK
jgi:hypothetical protein